MKKLFICLLAILVGLSIFCIKNADVYAEDNLQMIIVEGNSKVFAEPDFCVLNFNLSLTEQEFDQGQTKINSAYNKVCSDVKGINDNNVVFITYTSCYPVYRDSFKAYDYSCSFSVKTTDLEHTNEIIKTVAQNGEISFYGLNYGMENEENMYSEALKQAKDDAIKKAKALNEEAELKAIVGTNVYSYSNHNQEGKIEVVATLKCVFVNADANTEKTSDALKSVSNKYI